MISLLPEGIKNTDFAAQRFVVAPRNHPSWGPVANAALTHQGVVSELRNPGSALNKNRPWLSTKNNLSESDNLLGYPSDIRTGRFCSQ
jgi:hypothetical protein